MHQWQETSSVEYRAAIGKNYIKGKYYVKEKYIMLERKGKIEKY